ncbi:hypothetical protein QGN29_13440 [Temperatibacter marinus]|uniref:Lipoprotein n=1 Tax=Temperatibacter marinus TaxID=1456591 RepID=A0AA52ED38_9PROT|nr:hypothetical protein [Temperatibacter marinus]WND02551.1 hypothetical protein QGN29_13440 [Temperatibacter marinus]
MSLKTVSRWFVLGLSVAALSACARENPLEVTIDHCPAVAVMGDMGTFTRIKGDSDLAKDIEYTATLSRVDTECSQEEQVATKVSFDISVLAGPANKDRSVTVDYFVLTLKDNYSLISKKTYSVTLTFDRSGRASKRQTIDHLVPTIDQAREYDYEILLALNLTPNEVMRNIKR